MIKGSFMIFDNIRKFMKENLFKSKNGENAQPQMETTKKIPSIIEIKPIEKVEIKASEAAEIISMAVKFAKREITAVGLGYYSEEEKKVAITSIYPVLNAPANRAMVNLDCKTHLELVEILDYWKDYWKDEGEIAVIHSHPGFSCRYSSIDEEHCIRMATLLLGGKAVMIIIDPLSSQGIEIAAYALDPSTKNVKQIPFKLVP